MPKQETKGSSPDSLDVMDAELSKIQELGEKNQSVKISGRIYRLFAATDAVGGRPIAQFVGKVDEVVDEDFVGRHFGGGKFKVRFTITAQNGATEQRDIIYNIDDTYNKYLKEVPPRPAPAPLPTPPAPEKESNIIDKIFQKITPEYITAFALSIKTIKELFPARPQPDYMELMKIIAANSNKPAFSDSVVMKAMEMQQQQQRAQSPISQLKELKEIREFFKEEITENQDDGETMNWIKTAFELLPVLLQKTNNNFQAAGQQARQIPLVNKLIANDPELATAFIKRAQEQYGDANARALARGFGYEMNVKPDENPDENPEGNPGEDFEENPEGNPDDQGGENG